MKVQLIDYTGIGHADKMYAAKKLIYAKNTRLTQGQELMDKINNMTDDELKSELDYIANTIRSSWEMIEFTFQVTGVTRAFTHQLVRTRHGSYAQQAQRVVDMSGFESVTPSTVQKDADALMIWNDTIKKIDEGYRTLVNMGIPAQDARGLLPTNVCTNIVIQWNLRTFADIVAKRQNLRAQGEYADVVRDMAKLVLEVMPWAEAFLYPERASTPVLDGILAELLGDDSPVSNDKINNALKELDKVKGIW